MCLKIKVALSTFTWTCCSRAGPCSSWRRWCWASAPWRSSAASCSRVSSSEPPSPPSSSPQPGGAVPDNDFCSFFNCVNLVWKDWLSVYLLFLSIWKMVRAFKLIFLKGDLLPTLLLLSRKCSSSCSASGSGDNEERSRIGGRLLLPGCSWSISCSPLLAVKGV